MTSDAVNRSRRRVLLGAGLGAALGALDGWRRLAAAPDLFVHDRPPLLRAGRGHRGFGVGQVLQPSFGLPRRVEVLGHGVGPAPDVVLRTEGPGGGLLARSEGRFEPGRDGARVLIGEFDLPLDPSPLDTPVFVGVEPRADEEVTEFRPALRVRAAPGRPADVGEQRLGEGEVVRWIRFDHDSATAIAVPFHLLTPGTDPVRLTLERVEGFLERRVFALQPAASENFEGRLLPCREVVSTFTGGLDQGHLVLPFEPIEESRAAMFRAVLQVPRGAVVAAATGGFGFIPFHGKAEPRPPLGACFVGGSVMPTVDLQARYWRG